MKKVLLIASLLMISLVVKPIDEDTKFFLSYGGQSLEISRKGLELSSLLNFIVDEFGDDEDYFDEDNNKFTIPLEQYLKDKPWLTVDDLRNFVSISDKIKTPDKFSIPELVNVISLADILGAIKYGGHKPAFDVLDNCVSELAEKINKKIKDKDFLSFFEGKGPLKIIIDWLSPGLMNMLKEKLIFPKQQSPVRKFTGKNLSLSRDGSKIIIFSEVSIDGTSQYILSIRNSMTGAKLFRFKLPAPVDRIKWSPNGNFFSVRYYPNVWWVWKLDSAEPVIKRKAMALSSWSPNGEKIIFSVSSRPPSGTAEVWDVISNKKLFDLQGYSSRWSPDGLKIATASPSSITPDGIVRLWDSSTGKMLRKLNLPEKEIVNSMVWSPNGKMLATIQNKSESIVVWNAESGKPLHSLKGSDVAWAPSGRVFAVVLSDLTVQLLNSKNFSTITSVKVPSVFTPIVWSGDGAKLGIRSAGGVIFVWDFKHNKLIKTAGIPKGWGFKNMVWSLGGELLIAAFKGGTGGIFVSTLYEGLTFEQSIFLYALQSDGFEKVVPFLKKDPWVRKLFKSLPIEKLRWVIFSKEVIAKKLKTPKDIEKRIAPK